MTDINNFSKTIDDIKENKIKKYLEGDAENFKRVQYLYQDISQKMIAQQDEFLTELELVSIDSISFEKSIPTIDEEGHLDKITYLEEKKKVLIQENNKYEEFIYDLENQLSLLSSKKQLLVNKESHLSIKSNYIIPDKEFSLSLYTNLTGIKWQPDINNNNNNNTTTSSSSSQTNTTKNTTTTTASSPSQFIKGVVFSTQDSINTKVKPFSIDRSQYLNDFDVVNKIWDIID